ncbi:MAG: hypothetical protein JXA52_04980 [Planctomycetes bacterium]|nr:hypothetical protein [Planctomycetota bacterium]
MKRFLGRGLIPFLLLSGWFSAAITPAKAAENTSLAGTVAWRAQGIIDYTQQTGDFETAEQEAGKLFDSVTAYAPLDDADPFITADFTLNLLRQYKHYGDLEFFKYLCEHQELAYTLTFLIKPEENPGDIYALLKKLQEKYGAEVFKYNNLAAAIAVVHDSPLVHRINENSTTAEDPLKLFDYFLSNRQQMLFNIEKMPPELLIYVVDSAVSIKEMNWALRNYAGNNEVGKLFFKIDYDVGYYRRDEEKLVTAKGWNLPNILKYGGICADQAYFAVAVGKSIGVPTAYTSGKSASGSHAWVGFLQTKDNQGFWNFEIGRYEAYQGVRGWVWDPQTREWIPDGYVSVLAEMIGVKTRDFYASAAFSHAAKRLLELGKSGKSWEPAPLPGGSNNPRQVDFKTAEKFILKSLKHCLGYSPSWFLVSELARTGRLNLQQKQAWHERVEYMCSKKYPDFSMNILKPMVESVTDLEAQERMWIALEESFLKRKDLRAEARLAQGMMWEEAGERTKAGRIYKSIIDKYANDGPFVIEALLRSEKMLLLMNREERIPELYADAWSRLHKPNLKGAKAAIKCNWFKVGELYYTRMLEAEQSKTASAIKQELEKYYSMDE